MVSCHRWSSANWMTNGTRRWLPSVSCRADTKGQGELVARFLETDEQGAKAAIFNLNRITGRPVELEEAWIIYAGDRRRA
ncbi:MAG: hypothetical protein R3C09_20370 [Pirellulaceae bacterium]